MVANEGNVGLAFGLVIAAGLSTTIGATFSFCSNLYNRCVAGWGGRLQSGAARQREAVVSQEPSGRWRESCGYWWCAVVPCERARGDSPRALGLQECAAGPAAALSSGSSRDPPRREHPLGGPSGRPIVVCRASPRGAARDELGCGLRPFPSNVWVQPECGVAGRRGDRHADVRAACHAHCMRPYDARRGSGRDCGRAARHWLRATEPRAGKDVWVRVTRRDSGNARRRPSAAHRAARAAAVMDVASLGRSLGIASSPRGEAQASWAAWPGAPASLCVSDCARCLLIRAG